MKRTAFKTRAARREPRDPDRVRSVPTVTPGAFRAPQPVDSAPAAPIAKEKPVRSEAYRRAVASLPCCICGVPGYSQAAHGSLGKGMAIKASDYSLFPACCDRPGVRGCHSQLDQGAMFTRAARHDLEAVWAADTQRKILAMGLWPKGLPLPEVP